VYSDDRRNYFLGYDVSTIGASSESNRQWANDMLAEKNSNIAIPDADWFAGLPPEDMRFVPFNGQISSTQLRWLEDVLARSVEGGERCVLFTHMPIFVNSARPEGLMWNSEEVLSLLHRHGNVVAVFAGKLPSLCLSPPLFCCDII
jgi:3',5'-cyclic AMP phosphodiesterase CpdA